LAIETGTSILLTLISRFLWNSIWTACNCRTVHCDTSHVYKSSLSSPRLCVTFLLSYKLGTIRASLKSWTTVWTTEVWFADFTLYLNIHNISFSVVSNEKDTVST